MNKQEYTALVDRCKQLSYEYYVLAQPTVSDAQFDALVSEIEQAEAEHPEWTLADSPTQTVGSDVDPKSGRRLIRHRTRMLSCQKAQSREEAAKWIAKTEKAIAKRFGGDGVTYVLEWKYDGISCSLVYQDGTLTEASTRGEGGIMGQDLLAHVACMPSVPQRIGLGGRVEVRGEIVCPKSELARMGYKDCRTAAAALCNQMVPSQHMKRLVFLAWQMDVDDEPAATESMSIVTAQVHRFMSEYRQCKADEISGMLDEFAAQREGLAWPTDGVVIKVDEKSVAASLGGNKHHANGSVAYKFPVEEKCVTRVVEIEIKVGKTGRRTPVAMLEPVTILGREVKSVSLGSENKMKDLGVTEGCLVEVGLSNDVTPKIYRVVSASHTGDTVGTGSTCAIPDGTMVPVPDVSLAPQSDTAPATDEPTVTDTCEITASAIEAPEADQTTPDPSYSGGEAAAEVDSSSIDPRDSEIAALRARIAELEAQSSPVIASDGHQATETASPCQASDTDGDSPSCSIEDSDTEGTGTSVPSADAGTARMEPVPVVSPAAAEVEPSPVTDGIGNQSIDIVVVAPRPTERERNAAARRRRREQREAQRLSYEARLAQEAAEAEAYARQQERRKIFAAVGAAAVTLALIYFFGLLGPAVFGLLAGGLLKG